MMSAYMLDQEAAGREALKRIEAARKSQATELDFSDLGLTTLPEAVGQLTNLQSLDLRSNQLTTLPEAVVQLTNLQSLDLRNNQLTTLPEAVVQLTNLQILDLDENPLDEEIFAAFKSGLPALIRYLAAENKVYPRTVKVVLLGEPAVGKTTLLEAMNGNKKPCDRGRPETVGVNVELLERTHPVDGKPVFLSLWDFAGQHIEHATHQFYLTKDAIYVILWKKREGFEAGRDLWYWLELLKMRVQDPQFLLVATHADTIPPDLNLTDIEKYYPGYAGTFAVELCNLRGLEELEEAIMKLAVASPSMKARWTAPSLTVRDEIRELKKTKPHMTPTASEA